ncbi:MAG TPA: pyridoxal phosphate-dependent aminotransferase family protein [Chlamydiales bacterium]|nr:pyridoxal phosphate-dependent aminotransferase family protein [Chlamydiales bacterium]
MNLTAEISSHLQLIQNKKLFRKLNILPENIIDFSSNDYLNLSKHPLLQKNAIEFTHLYGTGSTGSRLISGNTNIYLNTENRLKDLKNSEEALLFNSGFQANISIIPTLMNAKSIIFMDKLSHNSLIQGAHLSGAKIIRFAHNNLEHLETLLTKYSSANETKMIIAESLYGMDGDRSDLEYLRYLSEKHQTFLYIDEAHAIGLFGDKGEGLFTPRRKEELALGTFGKAFGSFGSFIASSKEIKQYLVNKCPGFIYSTALPPAILGSINAALEIIPLIKKERKNLLEEGRKFKLKLTKAKFKTLNSESHIIPIVFDNIEKMNSMHDYLLCKGFHLFPVRPPTVPQNQPRLRIALSLKHSKKQIDDLADAIMNWNKDDE